MRKRGTGKPLESAHRYASSRRLDGKDSLQVISVVL